MKVDQEADRKTGQAQIGEYLSTLHFGRALACLELEQQASFDHKISAVSDPERLTLVAGEDGHFALIFQPLFRKLDRKRSCVSTLQKSRSQVSLHFDRTSKNRVRKLIDSLALRALRSLCEL